MTRYFSHYPCIDAEIVKKKNEEHEGGRERINAEIILTEVSAGEGKQDQGEKQLHRLARHHKISVIFKASHLCAGRTTPCSPFRAPNTPESPRWRDNPDVPE